MTDSLITDLETAAEGSRELDARIVEMLYPEFEANPNLGRGRVIGWVWDRSNLNSQRAAPHYTTSIDAAYTLIPEGWWWQLQGPHAGIRKAGTIEYAAHLEPCDTYDKRHAEAHAATPALALCAACLRAMKETDDG